MKQFILSRGFIHFAFAALLLPLQPLLPEVVKLALTPYVLFLIFRKDPIYLPALIALVIPGTTIAYAILISTFLLTVLYAKQIKQEGLGFLFILSLLPLPIFLYMTFVRVIEMNEGLIQTLVPLGYYLGIFPFFYGTLMYYKFNTASYFGIILALFLLPMFKFLPLSESNIRIYWLSFPVFFGMAFYFLWIKKILNSGFTVLGLISILFLILNPSTKFTLIASGLVAFMVLIFKNYQWEKLMSLWTQKRAILFFISIVVLIFMFSESNTEALASQRIDYNEISMFESWDSFRTKLWYKAFGDRSVIWIGVWDTVKNSDHVFWPPYEKMIYSFFNYQGALRDESEISAHNLPLELMRNYGVVVGLIIALNYFLMMIKGAGTLIKNAANIEITILGAGCLGSGFVGALVGQYPLMITFSLGLMALFGVFYGLGKNRMV